MKKIIHILIILSLCLPYRYGQASQIDLTSYSLASVYQSIPENSQNEDAKLLKELNEYANQRVPEVSALDSLFDRKLSQINVDQILNHPDGTKIPVKIKTISPNGVLTPEEKRAFFQILEKEDRTVRDIENGKIEVIFYNPQDYQRALAAREIRMGLGRDVILIEVPESMGRHFNQIAQEAEQAFFQRTARSALRVVKDSSIFVKDMVASAATRSLRGEFKKYIETVYIRPTQKDDQRAVAYSMVNGVFSSTVFWGLNMDAASFLGFLSTGIFTTIVVARYWRTINQVLKVDIRNPFKFTSTWREVFARVLVLGGGVTASQFAIGGYLGSMRYLPSIPVSVGNAITIGVGESYYSSQRNRILTPDASLTISLYTYILLALPSRAITQYAQSINFNGINPALDKLDFLWSMARDFHIDMGFMEFTGLSLIIFGSFVGFTQILKRQALLAETIARNGILDYLWKTKSRKEAPPTTYKIQEARPSNPKDIVLDLLNRRPTQTDQELLSSSCRLFFN